MMSANYKWLFLSLWLAQSCSLHEPKGSKVDGLALDAAAGNLALLYQGNIGAAANDMEKLRAVLEDNTVNHGFRVKTTARATSSMIYADMQQELPSLGPDGTLFLYFGGHGSPNGGLQSADDSFISYKTIANQIRQTLNRPVKRLVMIIFSCYSGSWINNIENYASLAMFGLANANILNADQAASDELAISAAGEFAAINNNNPVFEQLLIMTAANAKELSWFDPNGNSNFVGSLTRSYANLQKTNQGATLGDLVKNTQAGVRSSHVSYKAIPEDILREPLFASGPPLPLSPEELKALELDVNVAIGKYKGEAEGSYKISLATSFRNSEIRICTHSVEECKANKTADIQLKKLGYMNSTRVAFEIPTAIKSQDWVDKPWHLMGLNYAGEIQTFRSIAISGN